MKKGLQIQLTSAWLLGCPLREQQNSTGIHTSHAEELFLSLSISPVQERFPLNNSVRNTGFSTKSCDRELSCVSPWVKMAAGQIYPPPAI